MLPKPTKYQKRLKVLRRQAKHGDSKAMEEMYRRYHINAIMIDGELVSLKDRLKESLRRL
ncbi:MAG: hypothetical protein JSV10_01375 [Candidatus Zixiibacteriota bacterium]|nr:MAG: hypothetical protein JSV10_01375 [candidate division Zixibacteria bacterium]